MQRCPGIGSLAGHLEAKGEGMGQRALWVVSFWGAWEPLCTGPQGAGLDPLRAEEGAQAQQGGTPGQISSLWPVTCVRLRAICQQRWARAERRRLCFQRSGVGPDMHFQPSPRWLCPWPHFDLVSLRRLVSLDLLLCKLLNRSVPQGLKVRDLSPPPHGYKPPDSPPWPVGLSKQPRGSPESNFPPMGTNSTPEASLKSTSCQSPLLTRRTQASARSVSMTAAAMEGAGVCGTWGASASPHNEAVAPPLLGATQGCEPRVTGISRAGLTSLVLWLLTPRRSNSIMAEPGGTPDHPKDHSEERCLSPGDRAHPSHSWAGLMCWVRSRQSWVFIRAGKLTLWLLFFKVSGAHGVHHAPPCKQAHPKGRTTPLKLCGPKKSHRQPYLDRRTLAQSETQLCHFPASIWLCGSFLPDNAPNSPKQLSDRPLSPLCLCTSPWNASHTPTHLSGDHIQHGTPGGVISGEIALSWAHRNPANAPGADISTTHLLPSVLSPPCKTFLPCSPQPSLGPLLRLGVGSRERGGCCRVFILYPAPTEAGAHLGPLFIHLPTLLGTSTWTVQWLLPPLEARLLVMDGLTGTRLGEGRRGGDGGDVGEVGHRVSVDPGECHLVIEQGPKRQRARRGCCFPVSKLKPSQHLCDRVSLFSGELGDTFPCVGLQAAGESLCPASGGPGTLAH
ncbi:hypothetical protein Cadr_000009559 [Camelus dromedarius]|uniref:Uncharacterized protein n=1 Tax=Camelus dromedarius TaxID=9838 RepID=A0A5N4DJW6_CAMDR|nr:hypothetical protein Cadr_000009559 [Camelus dromedarius]